MSREQEAALRELGLAPGATPHEVQRARRALARVWHPDRYHHDPERMRAAEERLRRVNDAFRVLEEHHFDTGRLRPFAGERERSETQREPPRDRVVRRASRGLGAAWWSTALALLAFAYLVPTEGERTAARRSAAALERPLDSSSARPIGGDLGRSSSGGSAELPSIPRAPSADDSRPATDDRASRRLAPPPHPPTFTLGSSKEEVYAVQGAPRSAKEERWVYGFSYVEFDDDRVVGWYDSRDEPLAARLVPSRPGPRPAFFTVGSTKDDVLRVQGSPRRFTRDRWEYGYSYVEFEGDRVVRWYDSQAHALEARLVPAPGVVAPASFTVGSTKDEVLLLQGSPPRFTERRWHYGHSFVDFDDRGLVVGWYDSGERRLRARRPDR